MRSCVIWSVRESPSKSINRIHLFHVIVLKDPKNCLNCSSVLIDKVWGIKKVQRGRRVNLSIRSSVVDSHMHSYVTATENVVKKSCPVFKTKLLDDHFGAIDLHRLSPGKMERRQNHRALSHFHMISIIHIAIALKQYFLVIIRVAKCICVDHHIELSLVFAFSFVNWMIFILTHFFLNKHKNVAWAASIALNLKMSLSFAKIWFLFWGKNSNLWFTFTLL